MGSMVLPLLSTLDEACGKGRSFLLEGWGRKASDWEGIATGMQEQKGGQGGLPMWLLEVVPRKLISEQPFTLLALPQPGA